MSSSALSPQSRQNALAEMSDDRGLDILVVGGGVTGAGTAFDAATRGLRVGLVEAQDWAAGTSSRSSKLVHGGLRYLYNLDFKLVAEALRERGLLLTKNAPHLVKAQPFLWPLHIPVIERAYSAIGVGMYDALAQIAHRGSVPIQKHLSKAKTLTEFPGIKADAVSGAIRFYDCRVDDARLVINLVRSAARFGALCASRTRLVKVHKDNAGHVCGADLLDLETRTLRHVRTRTIISATGVWTEETQNLGGTEGGLKVLASKGIHLVVDRSAIDGNAGMFLRTEKSVLFIIPWKRHWVIGTTDTAYHEDLQHPVASAADIDYVLDHANKVLARPLTRDDVLTTYAGLRPLLQPGTKDPSRSTKISREHTVTEAAPGLISIAGGKLTTYRVMAEDAVDFALGKGGAKRLPSVTKDTPLIGADGFHALVCSKETLAQKYGLTVDQVEDLLDRFGSDFESVLALDEKYPELNLLTPLTGAPIFLRAEVAFAVLAEGALHLDDVMMNRIRLNSTAQDRGLEAVTEVGQLLSALLNWDEETCAHEITSYRERVCAELAAEQTASDKEACQARKAGADIVTMS